MSFPDDERRAPGWRRPHHRCGRRSPPTGAVCAMPGAPLAGLVDCAGVLKADAYGCGATVVGPRLAAEGCRQFFVAHIDEGIALRRVLPEHPIYVLNGLLAGTEPDFVEHGLTPVLNHLGQLNAWRAAAQRYQRPLGRRRSSRHRHASAGLRRRGCAGPDQRTRPPARAPAGADHQPSRGFRGAHKPDQRRAAFALPVVRAGHAGRADLARQFLRHLPRPDYHFDLLRPGAALCASILLPGRSNPMLSVVTLQAAHPADAQHRCLPDRGLWRRPGGQPARAGLPRLRWGMRTAISVASSTARMCISPDTMCPSSAESPWIS